MAVALSLLARTPALSEHFLGMFWLIISLDTAGAGR